MKISEVIQKMKDYHRGTVNGVAIDESTTRDKILFGNPDQECTGIVTTCYASVEVIRKARQLNANLIISHEALFWNHGDHTDWLEETENKTYLEKKKLLEEGNLVVWRDHDYIHSGIPVHGEYVDGIFYGVMKTLGWEKALVGSHERPLLFEIEPMTVRGRTSCHGQIQTDRIEDAGQSGCDCQKGLDSRSYHGRRQRRNYPD